MKNYSNGRLSLKVQRYLFKLDYPHNYDLIYYGEISN